MAQDKTIQHSSLFEINHHDLHSLHSHQPFPAQSPTLPSSESCPAITMASRSVPGSRRNSIDTHSVDLIAGFETKLNMEMPRHSLIAADYDAIDFFNRPVHRSMSVDVGAIHNAHYPTFLPSSTAPMNSTHDVSSSSHKGGLGQRLFYEEEGASPDVASLPSTPPHLSQGNPYLRRFHGSNDMLSAMIHKDGYAGLFSPTNLDLTSSLRRNSARQNKSVESLRSKSWAQCLEVGQTAPVMEDLSTARAQAAFYASPRRFSYGWPGANDMASQHPYDTPAKIRLSTSPSYSDLSGVNMSGRGYAQDPLESSHSPTSPCQHYQQQGFCSMGDQCSYTHSTCSYPIMPGILSSNNSVSSDVSTTNTSSNFNSHSINSLHSHSNSNSNSNSSSNSNNNNSSSNSNNNNSSSNSNNTTTNSSNNNSNSSSYTTIATPPPPHGMTSSHSGSVGFSPGLPFTTPLYQHYGNSPMMTGSVPCSFSFSPLNAAMYPLAASLTDKRYTPMTHLEPDLHYTSPPQQRRSVSTDPEPNRFSGASLADFQGSLYEICKDQNGCRFLQKKLEESSGQHLELIFNEIHSHFVELMTDPFGNYLCQKLLERCSNAQRGKIVTIIAPELLSISLNMHGTRAVQKLIEFLITPEQIQTVTAALAPNVVALIKDLNGNHVIQKCLHRLSAEHNQFIYDAVSASCIKVATHRHGCCVLQRCIDHAAPSQKEQLVSVITFLALPLVQDPFGNYVVQYVLDLGDVQFSDGLVRRFLDHVCDLSVQKFSSNVIEKCIRVSEPDTRRLLIAELATKTNMEQLLRDSFANYVVQTCLDYADPDQRLQLVECIRPLLPLIRSTPYGKRIYGKIQRESQGRRQRQHPLLHTMASMRHHEERSVGAVEYDDALPVSLNYSIGRVDTHPLYTHP